MFDNIYGNQSIKRYLNECIENNVVSQSYMFVGPKGVGKYTIAKEFAKNVLNDDLIRDFYEIKADGNSVKISQVREMQSLINIKPIYSDRAVYIIDDADLMTVESQNCLLKTLEEPPKYVLLILIVSNDSSILSTIKSRCIELRFNQLSNSDIHNFIVDNKIDVSNFNIDLYKVLNGSLSNIDILKDDLINFSEVEKFVLALKNKNIVDMFNKSVIFNDKVCVIKFLEYLNIILFNDSYFQLIDIVENTKKKINANNNLEMSIDNMVIEFLENI